MTYIQGRGGEEVEIHHDDPRLYLVSSGSGAEPQIVEANSDEEAVRKFLKHNGLQVFETYIVRYVSDPVGAYRVSIEETLMPHPSYKEDSI